MATMLETEDDIGEREWTKLSDNFWNSGYREGITEGKESALQSGFDEGYAIAGVPLGQEIGYLRGTVTAALAYLSIRVNTSSSLHDREQAIIELRNILRDLARIQLSDIAPPDVEAEAHAKLHSRGDKMEVEGSETIGPSTSDGLVQTFSKMSFSEGEGGEQTILRVKKRLNEVLVQFRFGPVP